MIIETSANQFYRVTDAGPGLDHCWMGVPVKLAKGEWVLTAKAAKKPQGKSGELVRKAGCRVVQS